MNHELIGQWFPLCGTVLDHQMTQTVGFDIIQLLVVCLLTAFCGMPRDIRSSFCGNICSELGALMLMLFFSLSMFFIPMSEDDGQDRIPIPGELSQKTVFYIISVMKWSMTLGLLGRIGKSVCFFQWLFFCFEIANFFLLYVIHLFSVYMLSQTKTDEMKEDEEEEIMTKKQKQE